MAAWAVENQILCLIAFYVNFYWVWSWTDCWLLGNICINVLTMAYMVKSVISDFRLKFIATHGHLKPMYFLCWAFITNKFPVWEEGKVAIFPSILKKIFDNCASLTCWVINKFGNFLGNPVQFSDLFIASSYNI